MHVFIVVQKLGQSKDSQQSSHIHDIAIVVLRIISFFEARIAKPVDIRKSFSTKPEPGSQPKLNSGGSGIKWGFKLFNTISALSRKTQTVSNSEFQSWKFKHGKL